MTNGIPQGRNFPGNIHPRTLDIEIDLQLVFVKEHILVGFVMPGGRCQLDAGIAHGSAVEVLEHPLPRPFADPIGPELFHRGGRHPLGLRNQVDLG